MKFGENLKLLRKNNKITQEELAEKVNVSRQSVSKWENGEAYPEMNNILELCKVFHCNIGELINDNMIDLDSLDEEIKMSVVKFKEDKQKKMKGLSKALYILSKIGKICVTIGIIVVIIAMIFTPFIVNDIELKNNVLISKSDKTFTISKYKLYSFDEENNNFDTIKIKSAFKNYTNKQIIVIMEIGFVILIIFLVIVRILTKYLEKLFSNLNKGETPFILENVNYIKKIAFFMIIVVVLSGIGEGIFDSLLTKEFMINFELFDFIEILFLFSLSYIFEYGYEIQLDSNGVMYGGKNE